MTAANRPEIPMTSAGGREPTCHRQAVVEALRTPVQDPVLGDVARRGSAADGFPLSRE